MILITRRPAPVLVAPLTPLPATLSPFDWICDVTRLIVAEFRLTGLEEKEKLNDALEELNRILEAVA